jgi:hypothetical protein
LSADGVNAHKAALLAAHRIRWEPGFNDPTFIGWFTVAAYILAALLSWRAATRARAAGHNFNRRFWIGSSVLLFFLAINKQLDLQVLLTDAGRYWAVEHGLYQQRRMFQEAFIVCAVLTSLAVLAGGFRMARARDAMVRMALLGLVVIAGYILIRAASFHHVDTLLRSEIFGMRWDWTVELAGLAIVAAAAWRYQRAGQYFAI